MTQLIPTTSLDDQDRPVIDATRHNAAVRLAKGRYQILRRLTSGPLILMFLLGPWLTINGAPLLWMDLGNHVLHLFGLSFWPDDLLMLTWLAMASAFALFIAANIAGRVWCGFSCPQTVWSMMFTWVEENIEGSRNARLKDQQRAFLKRNLLKLFCKHTVWLTIAFITGFTFVAYFETGQGLWQGLIHATANHEVIFWLSFFTLLTYINAGWLREQVCLHMCPYSRFQSVMVDKKTLKVSYDVERGEPRKNKQPSDKTSDCVDCKLCVQVCPVGIDIRQGLQYACIDCGACIDACDNIMDSLKKPRGLIHFSDENPTTQTTSRRFKSWLPKERPRLWGYLAALCIALTLLGLQVLTKEQYEFHLSRDRGQLYFYQELNISNAFTLSIQNKTQQAVSFKVASLHPSLFIQSGSELHLIAGQKASLALRISCISNCPIKGKETFNLSISQHGTKQHELKGTFFAPTGL
ncbi:cytochrome c oxidase accessory protein CcoG [Bermanella sp. WJH001]|uniref:cytochrome c oxidase accessory protein CcoG n=1 Tax=Bermanella sp. WJH001 TaxID=3048005 RepID=UPI0024BDCF08|nr:cytochrome c oxidase accessory protein CcoG [Bermanella sp. WJH001]MDJ1536793.1 cytochrome c oxidase accessory protein CcoG [Bermanella sp. WJH001]